MADEARAAGARGRPRAGRRPRPRAAARRADLDQGSHRHRGHADDGRVARARGARGGARRAGRRATCAKRARSSSARPTCTSSRSARRARTRRSAPARNPRDPDGRPGGSSGGSAASVVAGMALASVGTDTGGSIRIPSAACGVVGLKPAYGEVPADGVVPLSRTLDHVGPLAQTVTDAWLLYHGLLGAPAGRAARAAAGRRPAPRRARADTSATCWTTRCARGSRRRSSACAPPARASTRRRSITPTDIAAVYLHISFGDAAAYHAKTHRDDAGAIHAAGAAADRDGAPRAGRGLRARAATGARCCGARWTPRWRATTRWCCRRCRFPRRCSARRPCRSERPSEPVRNMMLRLTQLFNLTGHPAISVPCGTTRDGLPCAMQLVGPRMRHRRAPAHGARVRAASDGHRRIAKGAATGLCDADDSDVCVRGRSGGWCGGRPRDDARHAAARVHGSRQPGPAVADVPERDAHDGAGLQLVHQRLQLRVHVQRARVGIDARPDRPACSA